MPASGVRVSQQHYHSAAQRPRYLIGDIDFQTTDQWLETILGAGRRVTAVGKD